MKGLNYVVLPRATTNYFPHQNPKINLSEWQENLRVISPGGISPLRLIPGSLLRRTIPHLHLRERRERREEGARNGTERSGRIQYEATPQRTKHLSVLIFSVSYAEDRQRAAGTEDIRSRAVARGERRCQIHSLWWQSFPSGKHRLAEMDRVSRVRNNIRTYIRHTRASTAKKRENRSKVHTLRNARGNNNIPFEDCFHNCDININSLCERSLNSF